MSKLKFVGERSATFQSVPAGVLITVKPGETVELDGGFDYLKGHKSFLVIEDPKPKGKKDDEGGQGGDPNAGQGQGGDPNAQGSGDAATGKDDKGKDEKPKK